MVMQRIRAARASGTVLRDWSNRPLRLSERTINMSIGLLAMILDEAVRRPDIHLAANPARDKKLRVKVPKKNVRDWLHMEVGLSRGSVDRPSGGGKVAGGVMWFLGCRDDAAAFVFATGGQPHMRGLGLVTDPKTFVRRTVRRLRSSAARWWRVAHKPVAD